MHITVKREDILKPFGIVAGVVERRQTLHSRGRGYDTNRYNPYLASDPLDNPNTGPVDVGDGNNPVPEALNIRAVYDAAGGPML